MAETAFGTVRADNPPNYNDGSVSPAGINPRGEQLVAAALPPKTELTRLGDTWSMAIPTGSAYTNVANMPTTRAELVLYNGDAVRSYVIDSAWMYCLTSITAASGLTLIYQVASVAAPTDEPLVLFNSPLGLTYGGRAKRDLAVTSMVANKWAVLGVANGTAAVSIGSGVFAQVDGGIIIRPGYTLGLNCITGTAAGTSIIGVSWHEVELPN